MIVASEMNMESEEPTEAERFLLSLEPGHMMAAEGGPVILTEIVPWEGHSPRWWTYHLFWCDQQKIQAHDGYEMLYYSGKYNILTDEEKDDDFLTPNERTER